MRVRVLTTFVAEGRHREAGDEFEMADHLAVIRIKAGLVQRVAEEPRMAVTPEPELAVSRRGKR